MADIAKVNDDILYLVMSHCGRHEVSAMMKTCKFLNQTGAKLLLSWLTMLESDEDIISFTDFMLGGWGNRERLRIPLRVYIEPQSLSAKSVSHLTSMLLHWGHLLRFRTLSIFRAEQLLALDPDLPGAFGRIEFIGDLFISRVGPLAKTMLQSMRSEVHLARATIDLYGTRHRPLSDDYQSNPIFALASMRASLRRISGTWGATDPERNVYEDIVFQNVTSLKLGTKDPILVAHYAYSFPNVVNLDVSCITREEEQFTDWRNRNRTAQQGRRSWPRLTRFYGSILYWWALALKCEIERVELEDFLCLHSAILGELVQVARPKYLILNLTASEVAKQQFRALFHNEASQGLVALTLDISFEHSDRYELDVSTMLETLEVGCAGAAGLQWLQVSFECHPLRCGTSRNNRGLRDDTPVSQAETSLNQLDFRALVRRMRGTNPSLQAVSVAMYHLPGRQQRHEVHEGVEFPSAVFREAFD